MHARCASAKKEKSTRAIERALHTLRAGDRLLGVRNIRQRNFLALSLTTSLRALIEVVRLLQKPRHANSELILDFDSGSKSSFYRNILLNWAFVDRR